MRRALATVLRLYMRAADTRFDLKQVLQIEKLLGSHAAIRDKIQN